jgi:hypothetical protein
VGELSLPWRRVRRILARCAGCSRYNLVLSHTHDTTWSNTAEECCAQTLSDARLSPALYPSGSTAGRVLFMNNNTTTAHAASSCERRRAPVSAGRLRLGRVYAICRSELACKVGLRLPSLLRGAKCDQDIRHPPLKKETVTKNKEETVTKNSQSST